MQVMDGAADAGTIQGDPVLIGLLAINGVSVKRFGPASGPKMVLRDTLPVAVILRIFDAMAPASGTVFDDAVFTG